MGHRPQASIDQTVMLRAAAGSYGHVTAPNKKKHFIIAIDLTKSPSDGVAGGEVSFTGEHMRTSLATIQQKQYHLSGTASSQRAFICPRYDAIVEISAGGCDLLT